MLNDFVILWICWTQHNLKHKFWIGSYCFRLCFMFEIKSKKSPHVCDKECLLERRILSHMSLLYELNINEPQYFRNYLRMYEGSFEELSSMGDSFICKKDSWMRKCISQGMSRCYSAISCYWEKLRKSEVLMCDFPTNIL